MGKKRQSAPDKFINMAMVADHLWGDTDVADLALKDDFCRFDRRASAPFFDYARVPGGRQRSGAKSGADVNRVAIAPSDAAFGFRKLESVGDELFVYQIELAHHRGVGAAAGEKNQRAAMTRPQNISALPNPVFLLAFGQPVEIENDFPRGFRLSVFCQRRAPPQSTRVRFIAPKIIKVRAMLGYARNALAGLVDLKQAAAQQLKPRRRFEDPLGRFILFAHPSQCFLSGDIFKPKKRIHEGAGI